MKKSELKKWYHYQSRSRKCNACGKFLKGNKEMITAHFEEHIKGGEKPIEYMEKEVKVKKVQKTLSVSAIKSMIQAGKLADISNLDQFLAEYDQHKTLIGGSNRFENLSAPIGEDEKQILLDYYNGSVPIAESAKKWNMAISTFYKKAEKAALKLVFQSHEQLGLELQGEQPQ